MLTGRYGAISDRLFFSENKSLSKIGPHLAHIPLQNKSAIFRDNKENAYLSVRQNPGRYSLREGTYSWHRRGDREQSQKGKIEMDGWREMDREREKEMWRWRELRGRGKQS